MTAAPTLAPSRIPLDRETVERISRHRKEPDWALHARLASLERYLAGGWPTGQEEEWRRFPLKDLPEARPEPAGEGSFEHELSERDRDAGIFFGDWATAAAERADDLRRALGEADGIASHGTFRALAAATYGEGSTFVHVPERVEAAGPLVARKSWPSSAAYLAPRTIVVAEAGSRFTLVEDLTSDDGPLRVAVPLLEVHLGAGAQVRYVRIQRWGSGVWDLGAQRYVSARDSTLAGFNVLVGSDRTKLGVASDIEGNGASVKLYGLIAAGREQRIDVNSLQRLDGRGSNSDLLYLSALYEAAHTVYYGVIRVEKTSSGTGSYQECRNLLLSDRAGAVPVPVLEILTNDVARCGHGATAGRMDEDEIFYAMSRGFDRKASEQLLVRGFFQRVVANIPEAAVRTQVLRALTPRIGQVIEPGSEEEVAA